MALKSRYQKKEEIPSELAAFYAEREGAFVLEVEGGPNLAQAQEALAASRKGVPES